MLLATMIPLLPLVCREVCAVLWSGRSIHVVRGVLLTHMSSSHVLSTATPAIGPKGKRMPPSLQKL
jgi:hypothetical protein